MTIRHVEALEKQVTELSNALAHLGRGTTLSELVKIIRNPGWTTEAEFAFSAAILGAMQAHVSAIETLQKEMLAASKIVGSKERSAA